MKRMTEELHGARIYLDFPSVGATKTLSMATTLAKGTTYLRKRSREPEIVDLANILNKMGAKIVGAGTENMRIVGVERLDGTIHSIIPDRIEAGIRIHGSPLRYKRRCLSKMRLQSTTNH